MKKKFSPHPEASEPDTEMGPSILEDNLKIFEI